ncbi:hypothetical protein ACUJ46_00290 [Sandaracinobacteroides sp. A072]|uniref:hypothetical protein n=1 Tax=Sandaracinobacteroides sp. A072 TaxID=3461146 RepID=UPI004041C0FC
MPSRPRRPRLRGAKARLLVSGAIFPMLDVADPPGQEAPAPAGLSAGQRIGFLSALLEAQSFSEACRRTGLGRGDVLAARARDALFAAEWDRLIETRLAHLETLLIDKAIAGLGVERPGEAGDQGDKFHVALGQWILAERRGPKARSARAEPAGDAAAGKPAPQPAPHGEDPEDLARVEALIAQTEARIAAAEAAIAQAGGPAPR